MAREKGTGNLQREKSGRWTVRVGINGKRLSRSARTTDRDKAERFLNRFLAPLGLGAERLPLAEAWHHYEMSPNRRDIAKTTLDTKRGVWMAFSRWVEKNHLEITELAQVTDQAVAEYLSEFRCHHSANTYNNHVCVLREIFHLLADKAGLADDPFAGVQLRADDSVTRRELTIDEVERLYAAASKQGKEWRLLVTIGIYTGLRLGDCCRLEWEDVNLEQKVIQIIPAKTKKHAHGRPVTIPIHPQLLAELESATRDHENAPAGLHEKSGCEISSVGRAEARPSRWRVEDSSSPPIPHPSSLTGFVNPVIAEMYTNRNWAVDEGLRRIFKAANITMSVKTDGRARKSIVASFHSLRHTFVSIAANAGVPLPVVQSIVGHCSTTMTRHYYHENLDSLRAAVASIPEVGNRRDGEWGMRDEKREGNREWVMGNASLVGSRVPRDRAAIDPREGLAPARPPSLASRLKRLSQLLAKGLVTDDEYAAQRTRILNDL